MRSKRQKICSLAAIFLFGIFIFGITFLRPSFETDVIAQTSAVSDGKFNFDNALDELNAEKKANREKYLSELRQQIKGREKEPAGKVFKNVQRFKNVPAGRMLNIMDFGYSRSLGVDCSHCHIPGKWESFEKPEKGIAVEMQKMATKLNSETIKNIPNLKNPRPFATCTTCHRGSVIPATSLLAKIENSTPERPPTMLEFQSVITQFGWKPALEMFESAKRDYPNARLFSERALTRVGYSLLRMGRKNEAVNVFKLNVKNYPKSANAYDSLADGFVAVGKKKEATKNAKKAISLANKDKTLSQKTRDGIIKSAKEKLGKLKMKN